MQLLVDGASVLVINWLLWGDCLGSSTVGPAL